MRHALIVLCLLICSATSAVAQVSIGIGLPSVTIGFNIGAYPTLVRVPGYPVYYAPSLGSNYFFYDGMYWVYADDNWYAGDWYNGPWAVVAPEVVPLFILRVPVRYYRVPPAYFRGWRADAPPRWGEHWGGTWAQRRSGWDRWDRRSVPVAAPLPLYQRQYSGNRYPAAEQQRVILGQSYRYQPRDAVVRQHYQEHVVVQKAPATAERKPRAAPQERAERKPQAAPQEKAERKPQAAPQEKASSPPAPAQAAPQKAAPAQAAPQKAAPAQAAPQKAAPAQAAPESKGASKEPGRGRGEEKDKGKGEDKK